MNCPSGVNVYVFVYVSHYVLMFGGSSPMGVDLSCIKV